MRHIIFLLTISLFIMSCGQNETKQKESELKEKGSLSPTPKADTLKSNLNEETTLQQLVLTPLNESGDIGYVTFSQKGKTIFYFDAKSKKGKINLNGTEYTLNKMDGSYTLSGSGVSIITTEGKWEKMESDCGYGKSLSATIKMGTQVLKINNIEVQDCSSMVQ